MVHTGCSFRSAYRWVQEDHSPAPDGRNGLRDARPRRPNQTREPVAAESGSSRDQARKRGAMDRIRISGGRKLNGTIPISGAKNATLPLMIASLLTDETLILENVPRLADVALLQRILGNHGVDVMVGGKRPGETQYDGQTLHISAASIIDTTAPYELVSRMRASFWVIAPLVARMGEARVSMPGGCAIGTRPVDLLIMALVKLGARITGAGSSRIVVEGVPKLNGARHRVLPDRIETGTYAMAVAMAGGNVLLENARADLLQASLDVLIRAGVEISSTNAGIRVVRNGSGLAPVEVTTAPFPDFPTDLQAQLMALMTRAKGTSRITETIFENRFMHVQELARLGARIQLSGETATIQGRSHLKGAPVMATDLRASVSLVIAALAAEG